MGSLVLSMVLHLGYGQTLVGRWQEQTDKVSAGYLGNYQFAADGTFSYNINEYFGLARIQALEGNYSYNAQTHVLALTVLYVREITGGHIERSLESGEATDRWAIEDGTVTRSKLAKPVKSSIKVEFVKKGGGETRLVLFDKIKYYQVE